MSLKGINLWVIRPAFSFAFQRPRGTREKQPFCPPSSSPTSKWSPKAGDPPGCLVKAAIKSTDTFDARTTLLLPELPTPGLTLAWSRHLNLKEDDSTCAHKSTTLPISRRQNAHIFFQFSQFTFFRFNDCLFTNLNFMCTAFHFFIFTSIIFFHSRIWKILIFLNPEALSGSMLCWPHCLSLLPWLTLFTVGVKGSPD